MVNIWLLIAAFVAIVAITLHIYTFEVWIWPKLKDDCFPSFPFGGPEVVKGFYRTVWHWIRYLDPVWGLVGPVSDGVLDSYRGGDLRGGGVVGAARRVVHQDHGQGIPMGHYSGHGLLHVFGNQGIGRPPKDVVRIAGARGDI